MVPEFENWIALSLFMGSLKIVAKITGWVGDDAIHTLLAGLFNQIWGKGPPGSLADKN